MTVLFGPQYDRKYIENENEIIAGVTLEKSTNLL